MEGFLSVKEATKSYAQGCKAKAATSIGKLFGKAMLAGMMIGMGAAASSVAAHSVANVGLARLTAAVVFPVGLMMVILLGAELFTGDCLMALGVAEKHISVADCIRVLVLVFLGNFAGALIFTALVYCSGQLDYSAGGLGAYTIKVAYGKATLPFGKAFTSGILCNILVCAAVLMAICANATCRPTRLGIPTPALACRQRRLPCPARRRCWRRCSRPPPVRCILLPRAMAPASSASR